MDVLARFPKVEIFIDGGVDKRTFVPQALMLAKKIQTLRPRQTYELLKAELRGVEDGDDVIATHWKRSAWSR